MQAFWKKYGPTILAFLGVVYAAVQLVSGGGFNTQEKIGIGLVVAQGVLTYFVPLFHGTLGTQSKLVVGAVVVALGFLVDASVGGLDSGEKWTLVTQVLMALGIPISQVLGSSPPKFEPSSGNGGTTLVGSRKTG